MILQGTATKGDQVVYVYRDGSNTLVTVGRTEKMPEGELKPGSARFAESSIPADPQLSTTKPIAGRWVLEDDEWPVRAPDGSWWIVRPQLDDAPSGSAEEDVRGWWHWFSRPDANGKMDTISYLSGTHPRSLGESGREKVLLKALRAHGR
jgi:hypothetical protein